MSENIKELIKRPLFFEKNRVSRVYTGGALFSKFFGDCSSDGFEPEEWIASSVKAINKTPKSEYEGISVIEGTDIRLDMLLDSYKSDILGGRESFGVLTKVLDSAVRLPVQAHPDKAFSRKYFNSDYGKAESWIVLDTRPSACIYFGFRQKISPDDFKSAVNRSKTDKTAMEKLLNRVPVKKGDVFFVPAKMVHAIGKGCLILEIQEPTDFTIQPEYYCGDYLLDENEMYIGLDKDTALTVFDYDIFGEDAVKKGRKTPVTVSSENGVKKEKLITYDDTPCFAVERYTVCESALVLTNKPAVYVVTQGNGEITCGKMKRKIKKGDYFLLPCSAEKAEIKTESDITVICCLPPKQ